MTPSALTTGDIVLVAFPFTDLSGSKVRPALIIGWARPPDVVLAFITSASATLSPADVLLVPGDPEFSATGLRLPSRLRADRLATLETALGAAPSRSRRAEDDGIGSGRVAVRFRTVIQCRRRYRCANSFDKSP